MGIHVDIPKTPLRIVFMGSDAIALPVLNWLASEGSSPARIVAVFTQPDRPVGRGKRIRPGPIKEWALKKGIPVHQPERFDKDARLLLAACDPDLSLVFAYGHILRDPVIETPRCGTWNLHASLLPRYRGASPIQTAVACGERRTGMCLMKLVRRLDAGPVADCEEVRVDRTETAREVEAKLAAASVPLLERVLGKLLSGKLKWEDQNDADATYCRKLTKADGVLDFTLSAAALAARINGLFPWPACRAPVGGMALKLGRADWEEGGAEGVPGEILSADAAVRIATGQGVLRLLELQRPAGRMLPAPEFLRGYPLTPGTLISSGEMTELVRKTVEK